MRCRTLLLTALVAGIAVLALAAPSGASSPPARPTDAAREVRQGMFGLGGWAWPNGGEVEALSAKGLRSWRLTLAWEEIQPVRGDYRWGGYDALIRKLAAHNIGTILTLASCPDWVCEGAGPPRTDPGREAWVDFVHAAVRRYGVGGSFWAENPGVAPRPVVHWQVMNEVNGVDQWGAHPSPEGYAAFLKLTASAIRGANAASKVVLAGLGEKMTVWLNVYLPALYRQPGFATDFDAMAVEGYATRPKYLRRIMRTTRGSMRRAGDLAKPIWITEMSWSTGGPGPYVTTERGQAKRLRRAYDLLLQCRRRWNVERVYWFAHRDRPVPPGEADYWGNHNGLIAADGRWKPALGAFLRYLRVRPPRVRASSCRL
ncbi:MAG TPA: glycosyl hydrolase [Thermoleophilaceae bacterium]|nr:glycosyl hydrolase [Thermoleophilaceae bacterium]